MTALVSLLCITTIVKLQIFPNTCLSTFLVTIIVLEGKK